MLDVASGQRVFFFYLRLSYLRLSYSQELHITPLEACSLQGKTMFKFLFTLVASASDWGYKLGNSIGSFLHRISEFFHNLLDYLSLDFLSDAAVWLWDKLIWLYEHSIGYLENGIDWVLDSLRLDWVFGWLEEALENGISWVVDRILDLFSWIGDLICYIWEGINWVADKLSLSNLLSAIWDFIVGVITFVWSFIAGFFSGIF